MKQLFFFTLLLLFGFSGMAQQKIEGKVLDAKSQQPLAFVSIVAESGKFGSSTDIDGRFSISVSPEVDSLTFSYVGYQRKRVAVSTLRSSSTISLSPTAVELAEVEILPGENPAHRLINLAIANREQNNPEKATEFSYDSYNKLVFTGEPDSSYASLPDSLQRKDSSSYEGLQFLEKSHFFMMESVTKRDHIPPTHTKEVVTASRVSGMKTPIFTLIGTQLQSFSLYADYMSLMGNDFLSPLSKGSTNKYLFVLEDTLYQAADTIFTISFRARRGKNFDALEGFLTINTDGYAVQNFVAEANDDPSLDVKIQQLYEKVEDKQWFPVQLNTKLIFKSVELEDFEIFAEGRSYLKNIKLSTQLDKKSIGNVVLSMEEEAGKKDSTFWANYRENPLDEKEQETYHYMDSIGEEIKLDKKVKVYQALFRGKVPIGPVDLTLNRLMNFNNYEGFRLGLGAETNDKISERFRLGGYSAYGFKDKAWKYGGHLSWQPKWQTFTSARVRYEQDVVDEGGIHFYNDRVSPFSTEMYQMYFIRRMDQVERYAFELESHLLRDVKFTFFGNLQNRRITSDYRFQVEPDQAAAQFYSLVEGGVNLRFSYREKFIEMFGVQTPIRYDYPVVHLKYTRGFSSIFDGDFDYNRIDLKIEKHTKLRNLGISSFRFSAGYLDNNLPLGASFRARGSFDDDNPVASDFSFQSILPNEFYHNRYAAFFFRHTFKNLLFKSEWFNPQLAIVHAMGFGEMTNRAAHQNFNFQTMDRGFYESGIQLDRLIGFMNLGLGAFYRYGPYAFEEFEDNFFFKATFVFDF